MKKFLFVICLAVLALAYFGYRFTERYATTGYYFTASQPPHDQPGKEIWQSFYQWAKKHPHSIQPLCLALSDRCSINLRKNKAGETTLQSYISFSYYHKDLVDVYYRTKDGWKKEKSFRD